MKNLPLFTLFLLLAACADKSKVNNVTLPSESIKIHQQNLVDSLGVVTISLPTRYDTSFSWTNYSDCGKPCDKIQYRFQPKILKITKESGDIWMGEPKDSIERFTIVHSAYFPFHDNNDSLLIFDYHKSKKNEVISDPETYKIKSDTIEKIGDRYFSIISIDLYDTTKALFSKKILAATSIKRNMIEFNFELLTKKNDSIKNNFINNSKFYLRTIKISNDK